MIISDKINFLFRNLNHIFKDQTYLFKHPHYHDFSGGNVFFKNFESSNSNKEYITQTVLIALIFKV